MARLGLSCTAPEFAAMLGNLLVVCLPTCSLPIFTNLVSSESLGPQLSKTVFSLPVSASIHEISAKMSKGVFVQIGAKITNLPMTISQFLGHLELSPLVEMCLDCVQSTSKSVKNSQHGIDFPKGASTCGEEVLCLQHNTKKCSRNPLSLADSFFLCCSAVVLVPF